MEPATVRVDEILDAGVGKRLAHIEVPGIHEANGRSVPLAVIAGRQPGPTVWVNSALHGDEYLGPATVARLAAELEPDAVLGRLILTPTLNPDAVRAMQRADPAAPADLNRVWSGESSEPGGGTIEWAERAILPRCDVVIDLHSGGNRFLQHPFTVFPKVGGHIVGASSDLAKACGLPWVWAHQDSILENALITEAARRGKASVLIEIAGEGKSEPAWIEDMTAAVRGALAHVGLMDARPRFLDAYRVFERLEVVRNREAGLWSRSVEPGAPLRSGDPLGRVLDWFGGEREIVTSPREAAVAGICTYGFVPAQDYVAEIASGFHDEGPPG